MNKAMTFSKMHGLGNDFVIIQGPVSFDKKTIHNLANRHTGIGFDQLLVINSSSKADFSCQIFNADGSEAEQCGNGMRCVARFIHEEKLTDKDSIKLETPAGIIAVTIRDYENIQINMGVPKLEQKNLNLPSASDITVISMGNPHAILPVSYLENYPFAESAQLISNHKLFPNGVNIGFMEVVSRHHIRLVTFERGTGVTLACGSNSCAAVAAGIWNNLLDKKVKVELALGNLDIEWGGEDQPLLMTGPASRVFNGTLRYTDLVNADHKFYNNNEMNPFMRQT